jgi:hypothetical protein
MTTTQSASAPKSATSTQATQPGTGPFMLTLCRLASPVSIRPPQSPHLKQFKFFTSRARHSDGSERLYLHMGYFATMADAQKWAQLVRNAYPSVIATLVPAAVLRQLNSGIPTLAPAEMPATAPVASPRERPVDEGKILTDTQVLSILESRREAPTQGGPGEANTAQISLLRPEDSGTRRILKEAVAQGTPVSFAVQLLWSVQPLDLASVPSLSIFKAYTLYAGNGHRDGRIWHCLRLGFFKDAMSAKQVAYYVRSSFASVAVVPVTEQERSRADEVRVDLKSLSDSFQQQLDQALACDQAATTASPAKTSATASPAAKASSSPGASVSSAPSRPAEARPAGARGRTDGLEQTLELLATREIWSNEDSHSETGVRHLSVQIQQRASGRS